MRKRNDKWQVQVRRSGQNPVSRTFINKADAQQWAREKEVEADRQGLAVDFAALRTNTVGELVGRYMREVTPSKKSALAECYVLRAFQSNPVCRRRLSEISPTDFARYRDEQLKCISATGLKRELGSIRHIFEVARDEWGIPIQQILWTR